MVEGKEGSWDTDLQAAGVCLAGPGLESIPGNERKEKNSSEGFLLKKEG